jgi:VCBS repeat-containing protein
VRRGFVTPGFEPCEPRRLLAGISPDAIALDPSRLVIEEGEPAVVAGTFDPAPSVPLQARVKWGDRIGQPPILYDVPAGSTQFAFSHRYPGDGQPAVANTRYFASFLFLENGRPIVEREVAVRVENAAPVVEATVIPAAAVEGQVSTFSAVASDPGDDPLRFVWDFGDGQSARGPDVTHVFRDSGSYRVTLTVSDDDLGFVRQQQRILVDNVSPVAAVDQAIVFARAAQPLTGNLLDNDSDVAGEADPLRVVSVGGTGDSELDVEGHYGTLRWEESGDFSYQPDQDNPSVRWLNEGELLTDSFAYEITDDDGGVSSSTLTVTLIGAVTQVVVLDADPQAAAVAEDAAAGTAVGITAAASVVPGVSVEYALSDDAAGRFRIDSTTGVITVAARERLDFEDQAVHTVTVLATTHTGRQASADFPIQIVDVNERPSPRLDTGLSVDEDSVLDSGSLSSAAGLLVNDTDPDGSALTVVDFDRQSALGAQVLVGPDGTFRYDPTVAPALQSLSPGNVVLDSFSYTVEDDGGLSATATVFIEVAGRGDAPEAVDDALTVFEDSRPLSIAAALVRNDRDVDAGDRLTVAAVDAGQTRGEVQVLETGEVVYDPAGQFTQLGDGETAADRFRYTIEDSLGNRATAEVTVTVFGRADGIPPRVVRVVRNDHGQDFATLQSLALAFDKDVSASLDVDDLRLQNLTTDTAVELRGARVQWDAARKTARWDLSGLDLPQGRFAATLSAVGIRDTSGNRLDGNGDGTAGDDHNYEFVITWRGDTDLDLDVDFVDFTTLTGNFGREGGWRDGDFGGDGRVQFEDIVALTQNFARRLEPAAPALGAAPVAADVDLLWLEEDLAEEAALAVEAILG